MAKFTTHGITVEFNLDADHSQEILNALVNAVNRGLSACGERAVGYAQELCPVDTGNLRGSITYAVLGEDCYIGTDSRYARYVEFGTGVYAEEGGRQTPWVYQDDKGEWHYTNGQHPQPFIRPSASDHAEEYKSILEDSLRNA